MIRSEALGHVLNEMLKLNDELQTVILLNTQGMVLDSREIEEEHNHGFALPAKVQTELYAVLIAQAWTDGRKWTGIDLENVRICVVGSGSLLLAVVAVPGTPWGQLNELLDAARPVLGDLSGKIKE